MDTSLDDIRESSRPQLEAWLVDAREERRELDRQIKLLNAEIARVEAWLGVEATPPPQSPGGMTLQDAMAVVLREDGNRGMQSTKLQSEIARRGLYLMRSGQSANAHQIYTRAASYSDMFVRDKGVIRLREGRANEVG